MARGYEPSRAALLGVLALLVGCFGDDDPAADAGQDPGRDAGEGAICTLPFESGPCEAAFERWGWNQELEACERFTYGGCDGNANNFETPLACLDACTSTVDSGLPGAACMVGGRVFPSGVDGIDDPHSCNSCTCDDGVLSCTDRNCPEPCPRGQKPSSACAACDPAGGCAIVEFGCFPLCTTDADCEGTGFAHCFGDTCANPCS